MARTIEEILTPESGKILREAREARGISIADAAARLKLNPQFIQGMEAGDLRALPPGPYRKAFLSEYAKLLNIKLETLGAPAEERDGIISSAVSAVPVVAKKVTQSAVKTTESAFKKVEEGVKEAVEEITARELWQEAEQVRRERLGIPEPVEEEQPSISIRRKEAEPIFEDVPPPPKESRRARRMELEREMKSDKSYQEYEPEESEEEEDYRPGMSRATKTVVGLLVIIAAIIGYSVLTKKSPQQIATETEQKPPIKEQTKPKSIAEKKDTLAPAIAAVAPSDSLIFTIAAKDSVWISVTPDNGPGFRGKMKKGEVKRFSAKEKYILYLGNQKAVTMTFDGKPLENLPTIVGSNLVVRDIVLERDKISRENPEQRIVQTPGMSSSQNKTQQDKNKKSAFKPIKPTPPLLPH